MKPRKSSFQKYRHMPHVAWRRVEEESVLLNVDTSEYYSLDPVGTQVWERLGKGEDAERIAAAVADAYGIPESRVAGDVRSFISDLLREKLIHPVD